MSKYWPGACTPVTLVIIIPLVGTKEKQGEAIGIYHRCSRLKLICLPCKLYG